jgi:Putative citrate transport
LTQNQITRQLGPFAILLLSIAIFPLILRQHWERHYQKLCALLAATTCGSYVFLLNSAPRVQHAAGECATFIVVVGNSLSWPAQSICTSRGVPASGFLGYIIKYALPILVPVLALVGLIFFRG